MCKAKVQSDTCFCVRGCSASHLSKEKTSMLRKSHTKPQDICSFKDRNKQSAESLITLTGLAVSRYGRSLRSQLSNEYIGWLKILGYPKLLGTYRLLKGISYK